MHGGAADQRMNAPPQFLAIELFKSLLSLTTTLVISHGTNLSHFEVLEKLGEGGMGVVYKARDLRLDRLVAIKVLPEQVIASPERQARFEQEAKAAS